MKLRSVALFASIIAAAMMLFSTAAAKVPDWMIRPGTVGHALSLTDGSHVYLDAVIVDKIKAKQENPYFTIHECFNSSDRIIVLTPPSPELRLIQLVDVEGTMTTLDNGCRAIVNPTVYGYTDKDGNLLRHGPLVKGVFHPTPWQWKLDLTINSDEVTEAPSVAASSDEPNDSPAEQPSYYPTIADILEGDTAASQDPETTIRGVCSESFYDGIPDVQGLPDGSFVELQCKRIIDVDTENINGTDYHYIDIAEDLPATDWIRAYCTKDASTTDRVNRITGQVRYVNINNIDTAVICVDTGPGYNQQDPGEGQLQTAAQGTIAYARTLADGASGNLTEKTVTADGIDFPNSLYVEESNRSAGIRVHYTGTQYVPNRGDIVSITGSISTAGDGEREINAGTTGVSFVQQGVVPNALGMPNRTLGGGNFNVYTPGVNWPANSGKGLYNKGSLVKTWGRIVAIDTVNKFLYIDDGTGFEDGSSYTGVKVSWAWPTAGKPSIIPPSVGWYISVTGLSSSKTDTNGHLIRVIRPRDQSDLLTFDPEDTAYPDLSITTPSGNEVRKAVGATSVALGGTATDTETGVVSVEVKINSGAWQAATYNPTTHAWSYTWQNPQSATVWVRASDFAGHTSIVSRDISVITVTFVSKTGTGGSGAEWSSAKRTIQEALNISTSGSEVWVKAGVYTETISVPNGVSVYGGFYGNETSSTQRNWSTNITIIDARLTTGSVVTLPSSAASTTRIDGFTIRNGIASSGGGVYCPSGSPVIINNTITSNTATSDYSGNGGGGIYSSGSPEIRNNKICGNSGGIGGGIYAVGTPNIYNNTIVNNSASEGGGIYSEYSSALISNNIIAYNSSGLYKVSGSGTPVIKNNCVYGNGVYDYVGFSAGTGDISSDPKIASVQYTNLNIQPNSPCIDAGDDNAVQSGWLDIDGQVRIQGNHVDIGADESDGTTWTVSTPMIIKVTPTGNDYNTGSTWTAAKRTPQGAIDAIKTAIDAGTVVGGEVWVKTGTYSGSYGRIQNLQPYVYVYGGFAGTETTRSSRSWVTYPTILDGANSGSVVISQKPGYTISTVDGFTIRAGSYMGAGIRCTQLSSPAITNNTITNNDASYYTGGGIYCDRYCSPSITYNNIQNNTADVGGGVYCYQSNSPVIAFNTIDGNVASGAGGIYCFRGSPLIHKNIIRNHQRQEVYGVSCVGGGGIYCDQTSRAVITANRIQNNTDWLAGAAIVLQNVTEAEVKNNLIIENQVLAGDGGGLYIYKQSYSSSAPVLKIINNTFASNGTDWGRGGASYIYNANVDMINNIYYNNQAVYSEYYPANSVYTSPGYNCSIKYSDAFSVYGSGTLYHYYGAYPDSTCRELDPQFCSVTGDNPYWLQPTSQIRDMGQNPSANPAVPVVDKYDLPRPGKDNLTDPGPYEDGPFVRIATPKNNSTYGDGIESIRITAEVSGDATSVSYRVTKVGDPNTVFNFGPFSQSPYLADWSSPPQGCFQIVATGTFVGGVNVDSDPVLISLMEFCYPEDTEFEIISPYQDAGGMGTQSAEAETISPKWLKGAFHVHWYDDNNLGPLEWTHLKKIGTKSKKPADVADMYESMGYDFIAITEHNHLTPPRGNHLGSDFVWLEDCEEVTPNNAGGSTWMNHVLAIGINGKHVLDKTANYDIEKDATIGNIKYPKWPMPSGFTKSDYEFIKGSKDFEHVAGQEELLFHDVSRTGMFDTIAAVSGLAFIAHPTGRSPLALGQFTRDEIFNIACENIRNNRFLAVSCYTRATPPRGSHWSGADNSIDAQGNSVTEVLTWRIAKKYPKRMLPFTFSEEDYTPGLTEAGDTWIYLKVSDPGTHWNTASNHYRSERIKNALKEGIWWSCHTHGSAHTCPLLGVDVTGTTVTCSSSEPVSWTLRGPAWRGAGVIGMIGVSDGETSSYAKTFDSCSMPDWIVVVAKNSSGLVAESNPIRFLPITSSSGMAADAMSPGLVVKYLAPENYPDEMPSLGYVGGIYEVSGDLQQGSTLTLSFAGVDVTSLGIGNLCVLYYDPATSTWSPLTSTVDVANQEVSAQITTLGIYTISAVEITDTQAPEISWLLPLANAHITGTTDLEVNAGDNIGMSSVEFYLIYGTRERQIATDCTPTDGRWGALVDFSHYVSGDYVLKAEARDSAGNVGTATTPMVIQTNAVAPQVTINQPTFDTEANSVVVTGTASDADGVVAYVNIELDGQVVGTAYLSEIDNTWSYTFGAIGPGRHSMKAVAGDEYGNEGIQMISAALSLSAVYLFTDPDSQCMPNQLVTLTGVATGGTTVEYRFLIYNGTQWSVLQEYGTSSNTCAWTPTTAGTYTLRVSARERGTTNPESSYNLQFTVEGPLSAVSLSVDPSPRAVNTPVRLYAMPTGGLNWDYKFEANGSVIQDWASADMCQWIPDQTDVYALTVYAREQGTVSPVFNDTENNYLITGAVTAVSLNANPVSPQQVNTPIMLTAVPTGGGTVEYCFDISEDAGETWSLLRNFETTSTFQWTPDAPGTYKLRVTARDQGTEEDVNPEALLDYVINP